MILDHLSRKYPYVNFPMGREIGNDVLTVQGLSATQEGKVIVKRYSLYNE